MEEPEQSPIWIGPAQEGDSSDACSLVWPEVPFQKCPAPNQFVAWTNITLRNIRVRGSKVPPNLLRNRKCPKYPNPDTRSPRESSMETLRARCEASSSTRSSLTPWTPRSGPGGRTFTIARASKALPRTPRHHCRRASTGALEQGFGRCTDSHLPPLSSL